MIEFQIRKDNLNSKRVTESAAAPITEGQIRVSIEKFALTANNITYAVAGEQMGYWNFFPAINDDKGEWGVMPVWGFAVVSESKLPAAWTTGAAAASGSQQVQTRQQQQSQISGLPVSEPNTTLAHTGRSTAARYAGDGTAGDQRPQQESRRRPAAREIRAGASFCGRGR